MKTRPQSTAAAHQNMLDVTDADWHLRQAYALLGGAPKTRERVRLAITSCGGAGRNAARTFREFARKGSKS